MVAPASQVAPPVDVHVRGVVAVYTVSQPHDVCVSVSVIRVRLVMVRVGRIEVSTVLVGVGVGARALRHVVVSVHSEGVIIRGIQIHQCSFATHANDLSAAEVGHSARHAAQVHKGRVMQAVRVQQVQALQGHLRAPESRAVVGLNGVDVRRGAGVIGHRAHSVRRQPRRPRHLHIAAVLHRRHHPHKADLRHHALGVLDAIIVAEAEVCEPLLLGLLIRLEEVPALVSARQSVQHLVARPAVLAALEHSAAKAIRVLQARVEAQAVGLSLET
mmetsp:Transcript_33432/g.62337  ORF Transcript_33432/g.62337 Transcript_33432/m.62337 type:complete len:273 (+) Transcript_33432:4623-5441(+)